MPTENETDPETTAESRTQSQIQAQVVVVGAGPTGLMLACELALAGVDTLVVEKLAHRVEQVKGGTIQPRSAELLEARGLLEPMLARDSAVRAPGGGHFGALAVPLDCTPWQTRHAHPIGLPQWEIEEVLEQRAEAAGVRILRGVGVDAVSQDADGVQVGAGELRIRAAYAVGCDGAHSTVRKLLGLPFPGSSGTHRAVLADIRLSAVTELVPEQAGHISTLTRHAAGYWSMLVPLGGGRYRFTFGSADADADANPQAEDGQREEVDQGSPVTPEEISAALHAVYGAGTTLGAVDNASRFSDATRQLEQYRHGRVLFAGEAAHIHPPLGGQGLNLGLQDAVNLGWKLAAAVQDRAPEGLVDSYQAERHPVGAQVLHHTSAQRLIATPNPGQDLAALRDILVDLLRLPDANRHVAGLMSGLSLGYPLPGDHPLAGHPLIGHRLPDVALRTEAGTTGEGTTRIGELQREGHALLLDLRSALPPELPLPPGVDLVRATAADLPAAVVVLRPDGYVAWATDASEGPDVDEKTVRSVIAATLTTAEPIGLSPSRRPV